MTEYNVYESMKDLGEPDVDQQQEKKYLRASDNAQARISMKSEMEYSQRAGCRPSKESRTRESATEPYVETESVFVTTEIYSLSDVPALLRKQGNAPPKPGMIVPEYRDGKCMILRACREKAVNTDELSSDLSDPCIVLSCVFPQSGFLKNLSRSPKPIDEARATRDPRPFCEPGPGACVRINWAMCKKTCPNLIFDQSMQTSNDRTMNTEEPCESERMTMTMKSSVNVTTIKSPVNVTTTKDEPFEHLSKNISFSLPNQSMRKFSSETSASLTTIHEQDEERDMVTEIEPEPVTQEELKVVDIQYIEDVDVDASDSSIVYDDSSLEKTIIIANSLNHDIVATVCTDENVVYTQCIEDACVDASESRSESSIVYDDSSLEKTIIISNSLDRDKVSTVCIDENAVDIQYTEDACVDAVASRSESRSGSRSESRSESSIVYDDPSLEKTIIISNSFDRDRVSSEHRDGNIGDTKYIVSASVDSGWSRSESSVAYDSSSLERKTITDSSLDRDEVFTVHRDRNVVRTQYIEDVSVDASQLRSKSSTEYGNSSLEKQIVTASSSDRDEVFAVRRDRNLVHTQYIEDVSVDGSQLRSESSTEYGNSSLEKQIVTASSSDRDKSSTVRRGGNKKSVCRFETGAVIACHSTTWLDRPRKRFNAREISDSCENFCHATKRSDRFACCTRFVHPSSSSSSSSRNYNTGQCKITENEPDPGPSCAAFVDPSNSYECFKGCTSCACRFNHGTRCWDHKWTGWSRTDCWSAKGNPPTFGSCQKALVRRPFHGMSNVQQYSNAREIHENATLNDSNRNNAYDQYYSNPNKGHYNSLGGPCFCNSAYNARSPNAFYCTTQQQLIYHGPTSCYHFFNTWY